MANKEYTKEFIRKKLTEDIVWLEHGVLAIHKLQTEDEKVSHDTHHRNGFGFSAADAKYLSYVADYLLSGKHLSGSHVEKTRRKMLKYSGQLSRIANEG